MSKSQYLILFQALKRAQRVYGRPVIFWNLHHIWGDHIPTCGSVPLQALRRGPWTVSTLGVRREDRHSWSVQAKLSAEVGSEGLSLVGRI